MTPMKQARQALRAWETQAPPRSEAAIAGNKRPAARLPESVPLILSEDAARGDYQCPPDALRVKLKGCPALQRYRHDFGDYHVSETVVVGFIYCWTATFHPFDA
jgi:hypothetical protein